jgi:hypothetical protein
VFIKKAEGGGMHAKKTRYIIKNYNNLLLPLTPGLFINEPYIRVLELVDRINLRLIDVKS